MLPQAARSSRSASGRRCCIDRAAGARAKGLARSESYRLVTRIAEEAVQRAPARASVFCARAGRWSSRPRRAPRRELGRGPAVSAEVQHPRHRRHRLSRRRTWSPGSPRPGHQVRVLGRTPPRAALLAGGEFVQGDLQDRDGGAHGARRASTPSTTSPAWSRFKPDDGPADVRAARRLHARAARGRARRRRRAAHRARLDLGHHRRLASTSASATEDDYPDRGRRPLAVLPLEDLRGEAGARVLPRSTRIPLVVLNPSPAARARATTGSPRRGRW